jgi:hypothetical protein
MHLPTKWKPSNPFAHSYLAKLHRSLHQDQAFFLLLKHPHLGQCRQTIIIWNPQLVQPSLPTLNHNTNNISSNHNTPAIVEDDSDDDSPIPNHSMQSPCHHLVCPLQNRPLIRNQLRLRTAHMINCVIADKLMPTPSLCSCPPLLHWRYALAAECIFLKTISPPSHSTVHFIGAIIDNDTGDVLEYQHLMKMNKHKQVWAHGFANEIG